MPMEKPISASSSLVLPNVTEDVRSIYTLGRKLGEGQFGTTYLCTEISTGDEYACKSISKKKILSAKDRSDVYREIQILHHVSSQSNVVKIRGAYEDVNAVHIVMELCQGGELFDRIITKNHYSEREAAKLMKTIVGFVEACHSLGVVHRDLKPENFLFETTAEDSPLKATDFGLSVFFQPGMTFTNFVGSPYYIAPEVLHKNYGPEVDVWSAGVILYILLSGRAPFSAKTSLGILRKIMTGNFDLESEPWESVSDSAKDLIRKMLESNPQERLSAYQVLCHQWMGDEESVPDMPLDPAVLSRLKQFSAMNKLKKMACRVVAQKLSEEEIGGLKELFKIIDTDHSGTITYEELQLSLKRLDSKLMESEIEELMNAADIDENGTIDYGEFLAATLHLNKLEREENLVSAFAYFDKDGSGYITIDELRQACTEFGMKQADVVDMIKETDEDNDGKIDYGEFVAMMRRGNLGGSGRRDMRGSISWEDALKNDYAIS